MKHKKQHHTDNNIGRGTCNHTTSSANSKLICTSEFFKKYQNVTSPQGKLLNLNFLKNSQVQINFKLNEKSCMITY